MIDKSNVQITAGRVYEACSDDLLDTLIRLMADDDASQEFRQTLQALRDDGDRDGLAIIKAEALTEDEICDEIDAGVAMLYRAAEMPARAELIEGAA